MIPFLQPIAPGARSIEQFLHRLGFPNCREALLQQLSQHYHWLSPYHTADLIGTHWNVPAMAVELPASALDEIPLPALAYWKEEIRPPVVVQVVTDDWVYYWASKGNLEKMPRSAFHEAWSGAMVLAEKPEKPNASRQRWAGPSIRQAAQAGMALLALLSAGTALWKGGAWGLALLLFLVGTACCAALVVMQQGSAPSWLRRICGQNACQTLQRTSVARLGWASLAEIGLVYYGAGWGVLLLGAWLENGNGLLAWLGATACAALPFTLYGIYYQARKAKKWCPLCLAVSGLLWLQAALLGPWQWAVDGAWTGIVLGISSLVMTGTGWLLLRGKHEEARGLEAFKPLALYLKTDARLLEQRLKGVLPVNTYLEACDLSFGPSSSPVAEVILVTNLSCGPCREAHQQLDRLMAEFGEQVLFKVRFARYHEVARDLLALANKRGASCAKRALSGWYQSNGYAEWSEQFLPRLSGLEEVYYEDQARQHEGWARRQGIYVTPTVLVDGRPLPDTHDLLDLRHYLRAKLRQAAA